MVLQLFVRGNENVTVEVADNENISELKVSLKNRGKKKKINLYMKNNFLDNCCTKIRYLRDCTIKFIL
jgi:hypothetical protein